MCIEMIKRESSECRYHISTDSPHEASSGSTCDEDEIAALLTDALDQLNRSQ